MASFMCLGGHHSQLWHAILNQALACHDAILTLPATGKLHEAQTLISNGFKLANYRSIAFTPTLSIETPVWSELNRDTTRKEPIKVKQTSWPKKGRKKMKPIPSVEDFATYGTSQSAGSQILDLSRVEVPSIEGCIKSILIEND